MNQHILQYRYFAPLISLIGLEFVKIETDGNDLRIAKNRLVIEITNIIDIVI